MIVFGKKNHAKRLPLIVDFYQLSTIFSADEKYPEFFSIFRDLLRLRN
jgi:hypothetical protein